MVLYLIVTKGGKAEKTNWVMHQYHLGTEEDETNEYVVSKVFCQQPPQSRQNDINKLDPVTANRLKLEKLNCPATEKRHQRLDSKYTADVVCTDHELLIRLLYLIDKLLAYSFYNTIQASSDRELKTLGAETVYDVENFDVCTDNVTLDDIHADNIHLGNLSIVDDGKNRHVDENNHSQVAESIDDVENYDVCTENVSLDDIHADNIHLGNSSIVNDGENRHIDENNLFQVAETIKDVKNYDVCTDDVALDDIHAVDIDENRHVGDNADGCEDNSHSQEFSPFDSKNIWDTEELAVAGEDLFNSQPFLAYYARLGGAEHLRSDLEECKRLNSIDKLSSECRLKGDQEECKRLICIDDQEDIVLDAPHSDLICIGDNKPPSDCQKIDSDLEEFKRLICIDNQDFAPSDKEMRLSQLVSKS